MTQSRKKRTDRTHIIYELLLAGGNYVGVTAKTESTVLKSVRSRVAKHFYRARTESKNWLLCKELAKLESKDQIQFRILDVVRGKALGHDTEVMFRRAINPTLNTDIRGD
jgi:hypothetical protein